MGNACSNCATKEEETQYEVNESQHYLETSHFGVNNTGTTIQQTQPNGGGGGGLMQP